MRRGPQILTVLALIAALVVPTLAGGASSAAPKPQIKAWKIPFPKKRKSEMRAYSKRHYGKGTFKLRRPRVIVQHIAVASSARSVRNTFKHDRRDSELGELPNVCSHFVIRGDGTIFKLVNLGIRCRHTVGLNYTAIGIEHVGFSDSDLMNRPKQLRASLRLTRYLRCHRGIKIRNVIGHNESLKSPYHHERVKKLRHQTHGDMKKASMKRYRKRLLKMGC